MYCGCWLLNTAMALSTAQWAVHTIHTRTHTSMMLLHGATFRILSSSRYWMQGLGGSANSKLMAHLDRVHEHAKADAEQADQELRERIAREASVKLAHEQAKAAAEAMANELTTLTQARLALDFSCAPTHPQHECAADCARRRLGARRENGGGPLQCKPGATRVAAKWCKA